ncbi:MAG: hypothetical protein NTY35_02350 [Planctomycetota bacterium]|nr:hypothetical protein [Planctomycetota bacterium]
MHVVLSDPSPTGIWSTVELPTLIDNPAVDNIIVHIVPRRSARNDEPMKRGSPW